MTLLEPLLRRATFLEEVVSDLGLTSVAVVRARAEDYRHAESRARRRGGQGGRADRPTRGLGDCRCCGPAGVLLALKGSTADAEVAGGRVVPR